MAKERTYGYHPTEEPHIFEIDRDAGETLPEGWVDTPAKLAPKSAETAEPQAHVADAVRIDELAAELAALEDMVKTLQQRAPKPRRRKRRRGNKRAARGSSGGTANEGGELTHG